MSLRSVTIAIALAAQLGLPTATRADGALAIGQPADIAKDGLAYAIEVNLPLDKVRDVVLEQCRTAEGARETAKSLCRVVLDFRNQCAAAAWDPDKEQSGFGWAVAPTKAAAEAGAMAVCSVTAGESRRSFCKIELSECDGAK